MTSKPVRFLGPAFFILFPLSNCRVPCLLMPQACWRRVPSLRRVRMTGRLRLVRKSCSVAVAA